MAGAAWSEREAAWVEAGTAGAVNLEGLDGEVSVVAAELAAYGRDFGGIVEAPPGAVLKARTAGDVTRGLAFCSRHGIPVVARAYGQSGHGQAQARGALAIDVRALSRIEEVTADGITAGAGATWRDALRAGAAKGVTPPVFTNHIGVSLGGSTAIGGVGIASHRHGLQADNVAELEVATLSGQLLTCSPRNDSELFHAVLGGLGQFGIVTKLTLRTIPAPSRVAMGRILVDDIPDLLADVSLLARRNRFDTVDNRIGVQPDGGPSLLANDVGLFLYGEERAPDLAGLVDGVRGRMVSQEVLDYGEYMARDDQYVHFVTEVLSDLAKPWCVFILPESRLEDFVVSELEPLLNPAAGSFAFFAQPCPTSALRSTTFPLPQTREAWVSIVGIVRAVPPPAVEPVLAQHRALLEAALRRGGTLYPYGSVPLAPSDWPRIFGDRWPAYAALKRAYDPRGLLNPSYRIDASL